MPGIGVNIGKSASKAHLREVSCSPDLTSASNLGIIRWEEDRFNES